jgi:hypothetical protein
MLKEDWDAARLSARCFMVAKRWNDIRTRSSS